MTDRVLDIAEGPARLRVRNNQLVLERDRAVLASIPLEEVAVVLVSTPAASYSHAVLCGLGAHNGVLVVCDDHCMPVAMCVPLAGHSLHAERLRLQVSSSLPLRKRVWQQIVKAKIRMQSRVLHAATGSDAGLEALGRRVKSGDPNNLEGQASRRYWPRLFGQGTFRRDPGSSEPPNNLLNYGYAVVRAVVARAVVGAGLHPAHGIHHRDRANSFALADDLMEPFRPMVDWQVLNIVRCHGDGVRLTRQVKHDLLSPLLGRFMYRGEARTLFDIASRLASNLLRILEREERRLFCPESPFPVDEDGKFAFQGDVADSHV